MPRCFHQTSELTVRPPLHRHVLLSGVDYVVCWRTRVETHAAALFCEAFFEVLAAGRSCEAAFSEACVALESEPRPLRPGEAPATIRAQWFTIADPEAARLTPYPIPQFVHCGSEFRM